METRSNPEVLSTLKFDLTQNLDHQPFILVPGNQMVTFDDKGIKLIDLASSTPLELKVISEFERIKFWSAEKFTPAQIGVTTDLVRVPGSSRQFVSSFTSPEEAEYERLATSPLFGNMYRASQIGFAVWDCDDARPSAHPVKFKGNLAISKLNDGVVAAESSTDNNCVLIYDMTKRRVVAEHKLGNPKDHKHPFIISRCDFVNAELLAIDVRFNTKKDGSGDWKNGRLFYRVNTEAEQVCTRVGEEYDVGRLVFSPKGDYCAELKDDYVQQLKKPKSQVLDMDRRRTLLTVRKVEKNGLGAPVLVTANIRQPSQCLPAFSPDGNSLYFCVDDQIRRLVFSKGSSDMIIQLAENSPTPTRLIPTHSGLLMLQPGPTGTTLTSYQLKTETEKLGESYASVVGLFSRVTGTPAGVAALMCEYLGDQATVVETVSDLRL